MRRPNLLEVLLAVNCLLSLIVAIGVWVYLPRLAAGPAPMYGAGTNATAPAMVPGTMAPYGTMPQGTMPSAWPTVRATPAGATVPFNATRPATAPSQGAPVGPQATAP